MEVSVMGSSHVNLGRSDLGCREIGNCSFTKNLNSKISSFVKISKICVKWPLKSLNGFSLKASACSQLEPVISEEDSSNRKSKPNDGVKLFVGLPLDAVSSANTVNHVRAIAAGLKALKLLGVDGIELPVWWGVVEKEARGKYDWTGYLALTEMIQKLGLNLHVSLCFHASEEPKIPLPEWVSRIGESDPSIFFKDRSGQLYKDCLSFAVTDAPVLDGKTPVQVYKEFCESFKDAFSPFMGSTITGISFGLGPEGELRYPSHHNPSKMNNHQGAGEFQCYDEYMLSSLKQYAENSGNPLWGLGGPHDAPGYDQPPMSSNFFKEHGGSWGTTYGDFFLSWYSGQLISHGSKLLSLASETFNDVPISICGKIPLVHSWYRTQSHPSELTAGFYNTVNRDGYEAVIEMFAKHSCQIILPGMDLSDQQHQPNESLSSPELLLAQIAASCRKHGVEILGQNSMVANALNGFEQIKKNLSGEKEVMSLFTYQRMGADFFSPEHFPSFTQFVRNLNQPELDSDDQPMKQEERAESLTGNNLQKQTA
ncbi:PREDICTED: inactive beta-amylase 9 isoform X1 [Nicotiana attenuata]|uniref:Beta-amylase n=1 Tax=Nicotiana attenuata TaxID=49451 RepID=A0A1J6JTS5_NICAT|nr:PREDICTED: inactive beta-amylase 9 isoform X1 [Nicotiana attenuata]OIT20566.1 inactive beta-amylase 9 [Nicotiana attenuata]